MANYGMILKLLFIIMIEDIIYIKQFLVLWHNTLLAIYNILGFYTKHFLPELASKGTVL